MRTLVLGIGNLLLSDEGVGVHVARALEQEEMPADVITLEVGTAFLDALPEIEKADRILVVDAMKGGEAPGTVYRVPFEDCTRPECLASLHGFDLSRVIFLAGRESLPEVIVIGIEPARVDWGTELTVEIQDQIPAVIQVIKKEIAAGNSGTGPQSDCRSFQDSSVTSRKELSHVSSGSDEGSEYPE